jgi:hypothetical protein
MEKLFEVPYNFDENLIQFYKQNCDKISYLFLPPYKDDMINTRTHIQTHIKGQCYMPSSREEYERHLSFITEAHLKFVILWQSKEDISIEKIKYYCSLGTTGFTVASNNNAEIIKGYKANLVVISSIVRNICKEISNIDFHNYDYIVMHFPFNRALDVLKQLNLIKNKIILMPNTFCHTDCPGIQHWFAKTQDDFVPERDCKALRDIEYSAYIYPEHLHIFDNYISGYKLQGREYSTEVIIQMCRMYFTRVSHFDFPEVMLGSKLSKEFHNSLESKSIDEYYNIKTEELLKII